DAHRVSFLTRPLRGRPAMKSGSVGSDGSLSPSQFESLDATVWGTRPKNSNRHGETVVRKPLNAIPYPPVSALSLVPSDSCSGSQRLRSPSVVQMTRPIETGCRAASDSNSE